MTGLLDHLQQQHAFDPTPRQLALGSLHVPFDDLLDTSRFERRVRTVAESGGRVALVGHSGCGKSSVVWGVLHPLAEGVAPISVPVASLPREQAMEPVVVADQLIRSLSQHAEHAGRLSDRERRGLLQSAQAHRQVRLGRDSKLALGWMGADLAVDLSRQTEGTVHIGPDEKFEVVEQILARITGADLVPVLVFDDTDRWIQGVGHPDPRQAMEAFFGRVLRWAAELPCAVVVAAHAAYFADSGERRRLLEVVETQIDVPRLPNAAALTTLFDRRVEQSTAGGPHDGATAGYAFGDGAVEALHRWYEHNGRQLREVLQVAHTALTEACDVGNERITAPLIAAAVAAR